MQRRHATLAVCLVTGCADLTSDQDWAELQVAQGSTVTIGFRGSCTTGYGVSGTADGVGLASYIEQPGRCASGLGEDDVDQAASIILAAPSGALADHLVITDGSHSITIDAPGLGEQRPVRLETELSQPLHPGDAIVASDGLDAIELSGTLTLAASDCQVAQLNFDPTSAAFTIPATLATAWPCASQPAAGSLVQLDLVLDLVASHWVDISIVDASPHWICPEGPLQAAMGALHVHATVNLLL